ncbi:hypothetical protein SAMN03084138_01641 [Enterovibrio norvegicus DSM 15893]|uniref:Uncharacterized protein n=1 Tax=Enterovibrio norvegicus DSM 15893 TaxID=1121869 RepID=A0A1I5NLB8_9GAMM|nr:hypothetical protein SAMN03084138_01641 [Enterovibrio norvegicus DSM 15893]
MHSSKPRRNVR